MKLNTRIIINTAFLAFHNWETCNIPEVSFLKNFHRHVFNVTVTISVTELDRELEFFMTQNAINSFLAHTYSGQYLPNKSCEMMAIEILHWVNDNLAPGSNISVTVMEDNENGAEVSNVI